MKDYKVVSYGEFGIGKTSLIQRLLKGTFDTYSPSTIGASYSVWIPHGMGDLVKIGMWDTAGQERFNSLLPMYTRNADAIIYCWDRNVPFNPKKASKMRTKALESAPKALFYLVFTKIDKIWDVEEQVDPEGEIWAEDNNIDGVFYTSAFSGVGIREAFNTIATTLAEKVIPVRSAEPQKLEIREVQSNYCCY